jgi:hypothetical protein
MYNEHGNKECVGSKRKGRDCLKILHVYQRIILKWVLHKCEDVSKIQNSTVVFSNLDDKSSGPTTGEFLDQLRKPTITPHTYELRNTELVIL